jgi:hypothetical protein
VRKKWQSGRVKENAEGAELEECRGGEKTFTTEFTEGHGGGSGEVAR